MANIKALGGKYSATMKVMAEVGGGGDGLGTSKTADERVVNEGNKDQEQDQETEKERKEDDGAESESDSGLILILSSG